MYESLKFIASSLSLGKCLKKIKMDDGEYIQRVSAISKDVICFVTNKKELDFYATVQSADHPYLEQSNRRWDWVKDTLMKVSDQPVVIEVHPKVINVIFQY